MNLELQEKLLNLERLIEQEREFAVNLQIVELKAVQDQKGQLLAELREFRDGCPDELKNLAARLREGNRRNARLLHTTLNFFRQAMNSCCNSIAPVIYGQRGVRILPRNVGVLHTGKV